MPRLPVEYFCQNTIAQVETIKPICAAASRCQGFCSNELSLFETVLGDGVRVERTEYLLDGGQRCAYAISRDA